MFATYVLRDGTCYALARSGRLIVPALRRRLPEPKGAKAILLLEPS
jgi:hypothetical protein